MSGEALGSSAKVWEALSCFRDLSEALGKVWGGLGKLWGSLGSSGKEVVVFSMACQSRFDWVIAYCCSRLEVQSGRLSLAQREYHLLRVNKIERQDRTTHDKAASSERST